MDSDKKIMLFISIIQLLYKQLYFSLLKYCYIFLVNSYIIIIYSILYNRII